LSKAEDSDQERQIVLITGSRKGIGRYLVDHFLGKGARVIGCSRRGCEEDISGYEHIQADVADEQAVVELLARVRRKYGRLDILINNAGTASLNHSLITPGSTLQTVFGTNVYGTFYFCREAAKLMRRSKSGRIVNFSTVAVPYRLEGEAVYAASKAAVESLTRVLAKEFAEFGITVNAVGPNPIDTDLIRSVEEGQIAALIARQAIKRLGEHRDVANVVDFFVQPESDFITGQVVYLGGVG
jgi:3-oxoacyl-[acyl-carrier protein] reductase